MRKIQFEWRRIVRVAVVTVAERKRNAQTTKNMYNVIIMINMALAAKNTNNKQV